MDDIAWNMKLLTPSFKSVVAKEGDLFTHVYIIKRGQFKISITEIEKKKIQNTTGLSVYSINEIKKEKVLALVSEGDFVEGYQIAEEGSRNAGYRVCPFDIISDSTDAQLYAVPRHVFERDVHIQRTVKAAVRARKALRLDQKDDEDIREFKKKVMTIPKYIDRNVLHTEIVPSIPNPDPEAEELMKLKAGFGGLRYLPPVTLSPQRERKLWEQSPHTKVSNPTPY